MNDKDKAWIDNATLEQLLQRWRFSVNDLIFQGESGTYYAKVMFAKRDADNDAWVRASKAVGWERR